MPVKAVSTANGPSNKTVAAISFFSAYECAEFDIGWSANIRMHKRITTSKMLIAREMKANCLSFHIGADAEMVIGKKSFQRE